MELAKAKTNDRNAKHILKSKLENDTAYKAMDSDKKARIFDLEWEKLKEKRFREHRSAEWVEMEYNKRAKEENMKQNKMEDEMEESDSDNIIEYKQAGLKDGRVRLNGFFSF